MESIDQKSSSDEEERGNGEEDGSSSSDEDEVNEDNLPGKPCTCCDQMVLSPKPHKCNDVNHIGNRCVFAAFCLSNYDNGENEWNGKCLVCARRDSKVHFLILIAIN